MTILDPGLHTALRTLKLTGMLHTLDTRVDQARTQPLVHVEFLQLLCEDEIARRESAALSRRLRAARFEDPMTIEAFDFTANPGLPGPVLRDLTTLHWLSAGESVILYGPVGVGKSAIAQALGHHAIRAGHTVRFTKTSRLLADLAGGRADHTHPKRLREYTRPDVLILDDFAMRTLNETQAEDLYDLVSDRVTAAKPVIVTANREPQAWYPLFPNPVIAESLLDRLINTSHLILMDGPSYRRRRRPTTNSTTDPPPGKPRPQAT